MLLMHGGNRGAYQTDRRTTNSREGETEGVNSGGIGKKIRKEGFERSEKRNIK